MKSTIGGAPIDMMKIAAPMKAIKTTPTRNMEIFQNAVAVLARSARRPARHGGAWCCARRAEKCDDLSELKDQDHTMQRKMDSVRRWHRPEINSTTICRSKRRRPEP